MNKAKKVFFLALYYSVASKLPNYSFPGGKLYNWFRVFCMKRFMKVGTDCRIMRNVYVGIGSDVAIGDHCRINESCRLDNVWIGNHVMIARESVVLGKSHAFSDLDVPMEQQGNTICRQGVIEDDVWLGIRAIVLPQTVIKKGCIIAAGAVITGITNEYGIYGGVPAKLIRNRKN